MPAESAPAFQFYVKEWRSSRTVMRMTFAERGMYLEMLLEQWENLTLPDDPAEVADLIGGSVDEWRAAWLMLRRKFITDDHGQIFNVRLEKCRKERRNFEKWSKANARKGGVARATSATRSANGTYIPAGAPADTPADVAGLSQPGPPATASREPASSSSSSSPSPSACTPRAQRGGSGVLSGALTRDHLRHAYCGRKCVPDFLHAEFLAAVGGDPVDADLTLRGRNLMSGWYASIEAGLPDGPIGDEPIRFWRAHFQAAFPSGKPAMPTNRPEPKSNVPSADKTAEYLKRQRA